MMKCCIDLNNMKTKMKGTDNKDIFQNQHKIPFMEKFMVPQMYELFKFGGSSVKDGEREIQRMLQYFSGDFTEEQLWKNMC